MEVRQKEGSSGPNLSTDFDLTPYSRMGDGRSVVEVGVETLQQGIDLRKSEHTRQIEAKAVQPVAPILEPSQPLPSVPSESVRNGETPSRATAARQTKKETDFHKH